MSSINPYLLFNGNCEEAFRYYQQVFGVQDVEYMRFKDEPGKPPADGEADLIMHVTIPLGKGTVLMGSDRPASTGQGTMGDNCMLSISTNSEEEATRVFNALAEGGRVTMPLDKTFWGAYFGMLVDRFGINWMVGYDYNQQSS